MIRPNIKTFHDDFRGQKSTSDARWPRFLGHEAIDSHVHGNMPRVNIKKHGLIFEMEIAMPGFKKEEILITVQDDILTIKGERQVEEKIDSEYILKELDTDSVERKFKLAGGIGHEKIDTKFVNGLLKLTFTDVPVEEERAFKEVKVL